MLQSGKLLNPEHAVKVLQADTGLGFYPPLGRGRVAVYRLHLVEEFQGDQGALLRNTAAHQPRSGAGKGHWDVALVQLSHHSCQLCFAFREEKVIERPGRQFGFIGKVGGILSLDTFESFDAFNFTEICRRCRPGIYLMHSLTSPVA